MTSQLKFFTKNDLQANHVSVKVNNNDFYQFLVNNYFECFETALFGNFSKSERSQRQKKQVSKVVENLMNAKVALLDKKTSTTKDGIELDFSEICKQFNLSTRLGLFIINNEADKIITTLNSVIDEFLTYLTKTNLLKNGKRVDGRKLNEVRPILCKTNVLDKTHGSSLFQRGQTQVLNVLTLGSRGDHLALDGMENFELQYQYYLHHYNFPPYSVGEVGRVGFTNRREIGHGNLAQKALHATLPSADKFSYTLRTVSECLGSNGSSSMASTCASSLTLMDGGVPIKDIVSGVAMGLATDLDSKNFVVLTDISGWEDHHADMDFKITGNRAGITAIQLDNKIGGMTVDILNKALEQAELGRNFILESMSKTISEPMLDIKPNAPRMLVLTVPMDKMRAVIGSGGAVINGFEADFGVKVDLENETGICTVFGTNKENVEACFNKISSIIKEYKVGEIAIGEITRIEKYGAFIKFLDTGKESMIHISNLNKTKKTNFVEDVLNIADVVKVEVESINAKGQLELIYIEHVNFGTKPEESKIVNYEEPLISL